MVNEVKNQYIGPLYGIMVDEVTVHLIKNS